MIFERLKKQYEELDPDRFFKKAKTLVMDRRSDSATLFVESFEKTGDSWKAVVVSDANDGQHYVVMYDSTNKVTRVQTFSKITEETIPDEDDEDDGDFLDHPLDPRFNI